MTHPQPVGTPSAGSQPGGCGVGLDQVLVRPELIEYSRSEEVRILTRAGDVSLVSNDGRPNRSEASDHLPVLFELDL